ncbi:hypothetical protein ACEWY4_023564 [Coilia grayii]|uniref:Uncharacterized protein n=1 Tax=Coilia grayii TaxID=363190 RepID=A0ABD1J6Q1_9TELE
MLVVRFFEGHTNVQGILVKVQDALGAYDPLILTDGQGNDILDSEGTRGSLYWKQSARKILAVPEMQFMELKSGKRRRSARNDEAVGLQEEYDKIEEVVMAAQSLPDVTEAIKKLSQLAIESRSSIHILTEDQADGIRAAFCCCVCKGTVCWFKNTPCIPTAVLGKLACCTVSPQRVVQCENAQCVKCRADNFNVVEVSRLSEALNALEEVIKVD